MKFTVVLSLAVFVACGPADRRDDGGGDDGADAAGGSCAVTGLEQCADAIDNDCDGRADCSDVDCSGVGDCPICGEVQVPEVQPLALPDGVSSGTTCSTDVQCTD